MGGLDLSMSEVDEAAKIISAAADPDANIIFGTTIDESMKDQIKITVIATGFDQNKQTLRNFISSPRPESTIHQSPVSSSQPTQSTPEQPAEPEENQEDVWDIPAFLRQKN